MIGTLYKGFPAVAPYVVVSPDSWVFKGTTAIDAMDVAQVLEGWWCAPDEDELAEDGELREMLVPFGARRRHGVHHRDRCLRGLHLRRLHVHQGLSAARRSCPP